MSAITTRAYARTTTRDAVEVARGHMVEVAGQLKENGVDHPLFRNALKGLSVSVDLALELAGCA